MLHSSVRDKAFIKNQCIRCPSDSSSNETGTDCIDKNGCSILSEKWSTLFKKCVNLDCDNNKNNDDCNMLNSCEMDCKFQIDRIKCTKKSLSENLYYTCSNEPEVDFVHRVLLDKVEDNLKITESQKRTILNFINVQLTRIEALKNNCANDETTNCKYYNKELTQLVTGIIPCPKDHVYSIQTNKCIKKDHSDRCAKCSNLTASIEREFDSNFYYNNISIFSNCDKDYVMDTYDSLYDNFNYNIDRNLHLCLTLRPYNCDFTPQITAIDVVNQLNRGGYECANTSKNKKSTKAGRGKG